MLVVGFMWIEKKCLLLCSIRNALMIIYYISNKYDILFKVIFATELETIVITSQGNKK